MCLILDESKLEIASLQSAQEENQQPTIMIFINYHKQTKVIKQMILLDLY